MKSRKRALLNYPDTGGMDKAGNNTKQILLNKVIWLIAQKIILLRANEICLGSFFDGALGFFHSKTRELYP